jgi:hypothetical protein
LEGAETMIVGPVGFNDLMTVVNCRKSSGSQNIRDLHRYQSLPLIVVSAGMQDGLFTDCPESVKPDTIAAELVSFINSHAARQLTE